MPTYRFKCLECKNDWEERQSLLLTGEEHTSVCSSCKKVCKNIAFGGTSTLLKGRSLNKYLEGFPDQTHKINKEGAIEGELMEKEYDAYVEEQTREHPEEE